MAYFRKCRTCRHNDGCEIKDRLRDAIKGLGITSLLHRCAEYAPAHDFGAPVTVQTWVEGADEFGEPIPRAATFCGWFVDLSSDRKALVYVKPNSPSIEDGRVTFEPKSYEGFCKVPLSRVQSRPHDDSCPVCAKCRMVPGPGGRCRSVMDDSYYEVRQAIEADCPMINAATREE